MKASAAGQSVVARAPSIGRRLTWMLGAIAFGVFTLAGLILDSAVSVELRRQEKEEVLGKLDMTRSVLAEARNDQELPAVIGRLDQMLTGHPGLRVWVIGRDGRSLYGGLPASQTGVGADGLLTLADERGTRLLGMEGALRGPAAAGGRVVVAVDPSPWERVLDHHRATLFAVCGSGVVLTVLLGSWATRGGLSSVVRLSSHASRITPEDLSKRLPLGGTPRELSELAVAFNRLLDRVQEAYAQLEGFNADVAHELRTPLANLISGTEIALSSRSSEADLREALASNLEELGHLKALVNDMLFLARADRGEMAQDRTTMSLAEEAARVVEYFEATLGERGLSVTVNGDARVSGNRSLVRRAIANLLSNALRYTPSAQTIAVLINGGGSHARLSVVNPGPDIPADRLDRIFDRFYRADPARVSGSEGQGLGLGLAIVRAIARMHGGETYAHSGAGRTEVGFSLRPEPGTERAPSA